MGGGGLMTYSRGKHTQVLESSRGLRTMDSVATLTHQERIFIGRNTHWERREIYREQGKIKKKKRDLFCF